MRKYILGIGRTTKERGWLHKIGGGAIRKKWAEDRLKATAKVYENIWLSEELFSNIILFSKTDNIKYGGLQSQDRGGRTRGTLRVNIVTSKPTRAKEGDTVARIKKKRRSRKGKNKQRKKERKKGMKEGRRRERDRQTKMSCKQCREV